MEEPLKNSDDENVGGIWHIGNHFYTIVQDNNSWHLYQDGLINCSAINIEKDIAIEKFKVNIFENLVYEQRKYIDFIDQINVGLLNKDRWLEENVQIIYS